MVEKRSSRSEIRGGLVVGDDQPAPYDMLVLDKGGGADASRSYGGGRRVIVDPRCHAPGESDGRKLGGPEGRGAMEEQMRAMSCSSQSWWWWWQQGSVAASALGRKRRRA
jgi:hypothetical protein